MTNKKKTQYYCFECKYARSAYNALICQVYRGSTKLSNKACIDFELKQDFIRRQQVETSQKRKNKK